MHCDMLKIQDGGAIVEKLNCQHPPGSVVIHFCLAFSEYTAANKKHIDDFSDDVCQVFWILPTDIQNFIKSHFYR